MNEHLKMGPQGLRLLMDFEKGDDSVPLSENGAALAPYVCPGDELTIGYGCTHWFDGEPVQIHHRLEGEADSIQLLMHNLTPYEDAVRGALEREATQHQFDAMVSQCFNIGIKAFLGGSVIRSFNEGRIEDAAANFGLWTGSTTARPRKSHVNDPEFAPKLKQDHKGLWRWVGPEGQYCAYMLRLLGLLNRHYASALLFMGRDWTRTLRSSTAMQLVLTPTSPAEADWDIGKGRWVDRVRFRTPFKDVYARAYDDRLIEAPTQPAVEKVAVDPVQSPAKAGGELILTKDMQATPVEKPEVEASPARPPTQGPGNASIQVPARVSPEGDGPKPADPVKSSATGPSPVPSAAARSAPVEPLPKVVPKVTPVEPPVVAGHDGAKPPSVWTKQVNEVDYKLDPNAGGKPIEFSERGIGFFWQRLSKGFIYVGCSGVFGSGAKGFSELMTSSAPLMNIFLDLTVPILVTGTIAVGGFAMRSYGDWKRHRGQERASQFLY